MIIFFGIICFLYSGVILFLLYGTFRIKEFRSKRKSLKNKFSVIIPFRNEAENLPALLRSISKLDYPTRLFEILLINDASEDNSIEICKKFKADHPEIQIKILESVSTGNSPKKEAISTAIERAENNFILTTDADCILPEKWISSFDNFLQESGAQLISGPVELHSSSKGNNLLLRNFQELDIMSLQAATMGGFGIKRPFLCNAANLCFDRESFQKVNGYSGNENIASGDDIFLLEKFKKAGFKVGFLKNRNAIVSTTAQPDLKSLISQRIRWAAKTTAYKSIFTKSIGSIILLMNFSFVLAFFGWIAGFLPVKGFLILFLIKFNVDLLLIFRGMIFFREIRLLKLYFPAFLLYPFFSSYIGIFSLFSGYSWKNRKFSK